MSNFSSEALKLNIVPSDNLTKDELYNFINQLDPDTMGFDGDESPRDLSLYFDVSKISTIGSGQTIDGNLTIIDNLTEVNYSDKFNTKKYLVIHYTAGSIDDGQSAKANAVYFKTSYRGASAHYFVDCTNIVYRSVPDDKIAWHCGTTGTYYHNDCRNSNSIGVEICSYVKNGTYYFKDETIKNAINLCKYLVNKYNIPKENIIMHWHVTHKICAAPFMTAGSPDKRWTDFKNSIFNDIKIDDNKINLNIKGMVYNTDGSSLNVRSGPGIDHGIVSKLTEGDIVNISSKINNWYKIGTNKYVNIDYIKLISSDSHWCEDIKNNLLLQNIITDNSQWSRYNEQITKCLAIKIISNYLVSKGNNFTGKVNANMTHWASDALMHLYNNKIITDISQWENSLDSYISKALYMTLIANMLGGISSLYKNRNTDHWGRNSLDTLCDKKIITDPSQWIDFEGNVQKDIAMALLYKAMNYK